MLKLTPLLDAGLPAVLKLEGKLLAPWIDELHRSIAKVVAPGEKIRLDLSALSYADTAGTQALSELIERGAVVTAASGFIAALLRRET